MCWDKIKNIFKKRDIELSEEEKQLINSQVDLKVDKRLKEGFTIDCDKLWQQGTQ